MKLFLYQIFFMCFLSVSIRAEETKHIVVRQTEKQKISTIPGQVISTSVIVINKTGRQRELVTDVRLPKRWKVITMEAPYQLASTQSNIKLLSFFVPQSTPVGKYEITYNVLVKKNKYYNQSCVIPVNVTPFYKLTTELYKAPEYVVAGNSYMVSFLITNESNTPAKMNVDITSGNKYPFTYNIEEIGAKNASAKVLNVTIQTDKDCKKSFEHVVRLTTHLQIQKDCSSESVSRVKVISSVHGYRDRYHTLPVTITFGEFMQKNEKTTQGFQVDIKGEGYLDEAKKENVKFRLRGPDIYDRSIFARRDEYFASYWTDKFDLHIGDRIYHLTMLTERARYGRGIESKINIKNFSLGSYYLKTRWLKTVHKEIASYLKYTFNDKHAIGINYLNKESVDGKSDMLSLTSKIKPFKDAEIDLEYASGLNKDKKQTSYMTRLFGRHSGFNYFFRWIHASPNFPGYFRNTDYLSASFSIAVLKNFSFNAHFRHEKQNFDLDTLRYAAPLTKYISTGFQYRIKKNTRINIAVQEQGQEDRFENPKFNYRERAFRFGLNQNIWKFTFMARAEIGETDNYLTGQVYDMKRYTFSSHFRPTPRSEIGGYLYYNNYSWFTGELIKRFTAGVRLALWLTENTSFYFNFQNNYSPEEYHFDRNALDFRIRYTLPNDHQVYLQGRQTLLRNTLDDSEVAFMLGYNAPLDIPVGKKKNIGVVKGFVYDAESRKSVADLILHINGSTAVTDKNGKFVFPALRPQIYYLTLDKSNVDLNKVILQKSPIEVELHGGEVIELELFIANGSTCAGKVAVFSDKNKENPGIINSVNNNRFQGSGIVKTSYISGSGITMQAEHYGLANIIVELKRDDEVLRRITDSRGFFSFEGIRPGEWTIEFFEKNLPQYHKFEQKIYRIHLKPGDRKEGIIRVYPQKRQIRMQNENGFMEITRKPEKDDQKTKRNIKKVEKSKNEKKQGTETIEVSYKVYLRLFRQRKYQEALGGFQKLLRLHPQNSLASNCQYWVGECYNAMGNNKKSLEAFQAVLKYTNRVKHDDALIMCGIINQKLNNREGAKESYRKLIEIYPHSDYFSVAQKRLNNLD